MSASDPASDNVVAGAGSPGSVRASLREVAYFVPYLRPNWPFVAGAMVISMLSILMRFPLLFLPAILTAHFDDGGAPSGASGGSSGSNPFGHMALGTLRAAFGTHGALMAAVALAFAGIVLLAPLQLLRSYWLGRVGEDLLRALRLDVFGNLKRLNMLAVYERGAGPFVQRLTRDLSSLYGVFVSTLAGSVSLVLQIVLYLGALVLLEPRLTLLVLLTYAVLQPILFRFNGHIERRATRIQELHQAVTTHMLESVGGYRDIVAAGYFGRMAEQFREQVERLRGEDIRALLWSESCELLLNLVFGLLAVVPYLVALQRIEHVDQVGLMITYVGLQASLLPSLAGLWGISIDLAMATPSLRAVRSLVSSASVPDPGAVRSVHTLSGNARQIRFDGVGLRIGDRWIVRDLTFEIPAGRLTALIGQSGSGKTTIFHLMLRLLTPTCGTIWIDDLPLSDLDEAELRRLIGFIPQNPFMFNATIRENLLVACAVEERGDGALQDVIEAAQLGEVVASRRNEGGLEASAGYLGMRLSAGERQRIALGRLLVQDPQIVVCDEYTANIDVQTAALIQDMMRTRFAGRTRLVITHELYNARGADAILVLDHGRIVQAGTHRELVAASGLYRSMWETQRID